jgi:hypothetical protein
MIWDLIWELTADLGYNHGIGILIAGFWELKI